MRRAALSTTALTLPPLRNANPAPSFTLEIVRGRQTVRRHGIFFTVVDKRLRSMFQNFDGETILADECKCVVEYLDTVEWLYAWKAETTFIVRRSVDCPVDEHKVAAFETESA